MARTFSNGNYITHAAAVVSGTPLTLAGWLYPTSSGAFGSVISVGVSGSASNEFILRVDTDLEIHATAIGAGTAQAVTSGNLLTLDTWNHAAAVFTSSTSRHAWVNGLKSAENTTSQTPTGMDTTRIGARSNAAAPLIGRGAEVGIWNTNLSDDEILALSRGVSPRLIRPANLVGYWPVWGNDSPEPDLSGATRNMTLVGTPTAANHAPVALRQRPSFLAAGASDKDFRWVYNHNGAGYVPITPTSTHVKAVAATSFANDDDVREVLGGSGTYLADNNAASEDGTTTLGANFPAPGAVEFALAFQIDSENVSNGQTGTIRLEKGDGTALDGYDATFTYTVVAGLGVTAESGTYTLTGTAATLTRHVPLSAEAGSYALTGQDATLTRRVSLSAEAGSYALTGQDATTRWDHLLSAEAGSFTLAGTDAGLFKGATLTADAGSYALTGIAATLRWDHRLAADAGAYTLTGEAATLTRRVHLLGDIGAYTLTGTDATLTWNQEAITLTAESGSYVLTGQDATLIGPGEILTADAGSYALTGTAATLRHNYYLGAEVGTYYVASPDMWSDGTGWSDGTYWDGGASLLWNHVLVAEPAQGTPPHPWSDGTLWSDGTGWDNGTGYFVAGQAATLAMGHLLTAEAGSYTYTGTAATLVWNKGLLADPGAYALSGQNATLLAAGEPAGGGGGFLLDRRRRR